MKKLERKYLDTYRRLRAEGRLDRFTRRHTDGRVSIYLPEVWAEVRNELARAGEVRIIPVRRFGRLLRAAGEITASAPARGVRGELAWRHYIKDE